MMGRTMQDAAPGHAEHSQVAGIRAEDLCDHPTARRLLRSSWWSEMNFESVNDECRMIDNRRETKDKGLVAGLLMAFCYWGW